jgi:hypothetical protein
MLSYLFHSTKSLPFYIRFRSPRNL